MLRATTTVFLAEYIFTKPPVFSFHLFEEKAFKYEKPFFKLTRESVLRI